MNRQENIYKQIEDLCESQRYAVLSTSGSKGPYASLVAFTAEEECKRIVFATSRSTRKFANLTADDRVALLIDSRSNSEGDTFNAIGVTAIGRVSELRSKEREQTVESYLKRHPHLRDFVSSENVVLMSIDIETYYVVNRFQEVFELDMK
jgi:nitroimidazol reductase NimA-like FMN-containing flavoprotein (pyridoxamine 5'-phosphate oxidase superfamily)